MKHLSVVASQAALSSQNNPQPIVLGATPPIGEAVAELQLSAVFQPILAISEGTIFGFEGLIRGIYPDWPRLADRALFEGRDLAPPTDLRGMFKAVFQSHLGVAESVIETQVLPDSKRIPAIEGLFAI